MENNRQGSRGFTLIAALLILVLLSGVAAGLLFLVTNEARMGGNDLEDNLAYYGAESGMEKLSSDLAALYQSSMVPSNLQIQALASMPPSSSLVGNMTYNEYINYNTDPVTGNPVSTWNNISAGTNQGLYAEIVPMTLQVIAARPSGASINMTRNVEIALIPVFQFGVFCADDCSYFAGPNFSFGGRVHANGNLFLAGGANLVFNDKVAAYGQIVTDELENGFSTSTQYGGTTWVPTASSGCPLNTFPPTGSNCEAFPSSSTVPGDASWSGGVPAIGGTANPNFTSISEGAPSSVPPGFNGFLQNALTGAGNLQLPFVQNPCSVTNPPPNCTDPAQLLRQPLVGESSTSTLGQSREYNKAQIRILLADTNANLHPGEGTANEPGDFQFYTSAAGETVPGVTGTQPFGVATVGSNGWVAPTGKAGWGSYDLLGEMTTNPAAAPGTGTWIRVEYKNAAGVWTAVTSEWLQLGFGRGFDTVPKGPFGSANQNSVNPKAILILQQLRPGLAQTSANETLSSSWYPINFYDAREGEMRDLAQAANSCAVGGIMNAVELDVGNLALWLKGTIPGSGTLVDYTAQNGYLIYFSDRRGMLPNPNPTGSSPAGVLTGEAGLEDVVNWTQNSASTTPDGVLEATAPAYYAYSPEDVDMNAMLDNWGGKNIGIGFGINTNTATPNPYLRIGGCNTASNNGTGISNAVTGARHALKLVDGSLGNLPLRPDNGLGGFTVASENPIYVQGDYNTSAADPFWATANNTTPTQATHSAAAVIADAVTVLSNTWSDANSLTYPTTLSCGSTPAATYRCAGSNGLPSGSPAYVDTYYRMAVSGGKNIPFPWPTWAGGANFKDFGTDGGMHNFLRYLENWGNVNLWYNGSLVSMYYSEYDTGTFKCCTTVYNPPARKYYFDTLFLNPANLPPGTPMFQDVVNLSYHQNFTPQ